MNNNATISRLAYRTLFHGLDIIGFDLQAFTDATGISHDFSSNFDELVPVADYYAAWHKAIELSGQPILGLISGANMHPGNMGALGYSMMNTPLTGDAFRLFFRFQHMDNNSLLTHYAEEGDDMVVTLASDDFSPHQLGPLMEVLAAGYGRMFHQLTNFQLVDKYNYRAAHFMHKPFADPAIYEKILRCPVHFEQENYRFVFDRGVMSEKVHQADPAILDSLIHTISTATAYNPDKSSTNPQLIDEIEQYLHQHLSSGLPDSHDVAKALAMSVSTFKRRLKDLNHNYRDICQQFRLNQARQLLATNALSINEIAFMLGFASPSAFSRAFKTWTRDSPSDYVHKHVV
jgi:AraC-like DNA-binding protein